MSGTKCLGKLSGCQFPVENYFFQIAVDGVVFQNSFQISDGIHMTVSYHHHVLFRYKRECEEEMFQRRQNLERKENQIQRKLTTKIFDRNSNCSLYSGPSDFFTIYFFK